MLLSSFKMHRKRLCVDFVMISQKTPFSPSAGIYLTVNVSDGIWNLRLKPMYISVSFFFFSIFTIVVSSLLVLSAI